MKTNIARKSQKTVLFLEKPLEGFDPYAEYNEYGGWNPKLKEFIPMQFLSLVTEGEDPISSTNHMLDCIALGYEAGYFKNTEQFLRGAFVGPRDLLAFCEQLRDYQYWLNERHFYAFLDLLREDETGMRTYEEVADALEEACRNF